MKRLGLSFPTEFGWVTVEVAGKELSRVSFSNKGLNDRAVLLQRLRSDLTRYFKGERVDLGVYDVNLDRYTDFERRVLIALRRIDYGNTISYSGLARMAGRPNAHRAVGNVMAKNDFPVVIPCHRVVAANGIGGFTGGLKLKRRLLALENVRI